MSGPNLLLPDENNVLYGDLELLFISKLINRIEIYKYHHYFNILFIIILSCKMVWFKIYSNHNLKVEISKLTLRVLLIISLRFFFLWSQLILNQIHTDICQLICFKWVK